MGGGTGDYTVAKTALQDLQQNGNLKLQEKFTDVFSFNNKENSEMIFALHSGKEDDFMMWRDYNWRNNMVPQREYMAGYCDETGTPFLNTGIQPTRLNALPSKERSLPKIIPRR